MRRRRYLFIKYDFSTYSVVYLVPAKQASAYSVLSRDQLDWTATNGSRKSFLSRPTPWTTVPAVELNRAFCRATSVVGRRAFPFRGYTTERTKAAYTMTATPF